MAKENEKKVKERERQREKGGRHNPFGVIHRRKRIRMGDKRQI